MSNNERPGVHWTFWLVAIFTLLWNLMGCMNFFMQMNANMLASMPESHRAIAEARPLWATAAFGLSVFGGVLGALFLLRKSSLATLCFLASAVGVLVTMGHAAASIGSTVNFGPFELILGVLAPTVLAVFLVWYSKRCERLGWIK